MRRAPRLVIVLLTLALGFAAHRAIATSATGSAHRSLQSLPLALGSWRGIEGALAPEMLAALRVDDYILRQYRGVSQVPVTLYIAYYGNPHLNERIHAPSACLPAGGWLPIEVGRAEISVPGGPSAPIVANRYVIEKGLDRQVVLYWFQGRGRVVANDVAATLFLAYDTLTGRGRDEMLVRVSAPVLTNGGETLAAEMGFTQAFYPLLHRFLAGSSGKHDIERSALTIEMGMMGVPRSPYNYE